MVESGYAVYLLAEIKEFVSAFKTPAFRWLWIQSVVHGCIGGIIQ
jgi:hypothetical protein